MVKCLVTFMKFSIVSVISGISGNSRQSTWPIGHVLLMSKASWTNNFLNQKAMFTQWNLVHTWSPIMCGKETHRWQVLDNCFVCFRSLIEVKPVRTSKAKRQEIKIELGNICCCYFRVVVILYWMGSSRGCKILSPSTHDIKQGYHLQNLYRIRLQIIKLH